MPAALAIPAIIGAAGAGAQLVGAKMASNAAHSAATQQQQSVNQAQQFNQQAWQQQQQALAPYQQAGAQALGSLMSRYGQNDPAAAAQRVNAFTNAAQQRTPSQGFPAPQGQGMSLGSAMQQGAPNGPQQGMQPMQQPQGGSMVTLRAPTGQMAQFPMGSPEIQRAMQAGAQRVA